MKVTVTEVLNVEQKTSKAGKQYSLTTFKGSDGGFYQNVYGKLDQGQEIEGDWVDDQYGGKKFEIAKPSGGFGGGRAQDPATRSSIERQSALKASIDAVRDYYAIVPDPELTLEKYVTKVVNITNVFAKAIAGADAKQPEAKTQHPEVLGGQEVDQLPGGKPETDQINLDDIPF